MTTPPAAVTFRERLIPGPMLFVALLLLLPSVALVVTPFDAAIALPVAIVVYVLISGSLLMMAPVLQVSGGKLIAGRAAIPIELLGEIEILGAERLRSTLGPGLDARAFLMVRGYIHSGLKIKIQDPQDPTPYWVITSRKPKALRAAIAAAREIV